MKQYPLFNLLLGVGLVVLALFLPRTSFAATPVQLWSKGTGSSLVSNAWSRLAVDSSKNAYYAFDGTVYKFGPNSSTSVWAVDPGGDYDINGIAVDSSGNVYTVDGFDNQNDTSEIYKITSAGSPSAFANVTMLPSNSCFGDGVAVDSSGNVYWTGTCTNSGYFSSYTIKFNSAGTQLWASWGLGGSTCGGSLSAGDLIKIGGPSNNIYIVGYAECGASRKNEWFVMEYNSSGGLMYDPVYPRSYTYNAENGLAIDSSGNAYISANANNSVAVDESGSRATNYGKLVKFSSGSLYDIYDTAVGGGVYGVNIDSSGDLYVEINGNFNEYSSPSLSTLIWSVATPYGAWSYTYNFWQYVEIAVDDYAIDNSGGFYVMNPICSNYSSYTCSGQVMGNYYGAYLYRYGSPCNTTMNAGGGTWTLSTVAATCPAWLDITTANSVTNGNLLIDQQMIIENGGSLGYSSGYHISFSGSGAIILRGSPVGYVHSP
jgi:hypothetical protein